MRRLLAMAALSLAACSYDAVDTPVTIQVDGIPAAADHLDVTVTPAVGTARDYHPAFQPGALASSSLVMSIAAPVAAGAFTVSITAADRNLATLATGTTLGSIPGQEALQVTLH